MTSFLGLKTGDLEWFNTPQTLQEVVQKSANDLPVVVRLLRNVNSTVPSDMSRFDVYMIHGVRNEHKLRGTVHISSRERFHLTIPRSFPGYLNVHSQHGGTERSVDEVLYDNTYPLTASFGEYSRQTHEILRQLQCETIVIENPIVESYVIATSYHDNGERYIYYLPLYLHIQFLVERGNSCRFLKEWHEFVVQNVLGCTEVVTSGLTSFMPNIEIERDGEQKVYSHVVTWEQSPKAPMLPPKQSLYKQENTYECVWMAGSGGSQNQSHYQLPIGAKAPDRRNIRSHSVDELMTSPVTGVPIPPPRRKHRIKSEGDHVYEHIEVSDPKEKVPVATIEEKVTPATDSQRYEVVPSGSFASPLNSMGMEVPPLPEKKRPLKVSTEKSSLVGDSCLRSIGLETNQPRVSTTRPYTDLIKSERPAYTKLEIQDDAEQKGISSMSVEDVCQLLREEIFLPDYIINVFIEKNVDGARLKDMNANIFQEVFHLSPFHSRKLVNYIHKNK